MTIVKHAHGNGIAILLAAFGLAGCATTLTEDEQYELDSRQAERMDEIHELIRACEDAGMLPVYFGPVRHKLLNPFRHVSRHAHPSDYGCSSQRDMERTLRESGVMM